MDDARRILEDAVRERRPCRIARLGGAWLPGVLVRLEPSGLVCNLPEHGLRGGEEVRLWFEDDGRPSYFEASVLRTGVPVPDRGASGLLLGFLSAVQAPPPPVVSGAAEKPSQLPILEVRLGSGAPVSLLVTPVDIVELTIDSLEFQVPRQFTVMFPENGVLNLRFGACAADAYEVRGRVRLVVSGDTTRLYRVELEQVERQDLHQQAVPVLRRATLR